MKSIAYVFSALILLLASAVTVAQPYPNRAIKIIIPFPAGGGTDIFARTVGQKLTENYKWTVVPENRPVRVATSELRRYRTRQQMAIPLAWVKLAI